MHAGQTTEMKRGAIWAGVISVGLGLIASSLIVIGPLQRFLMVGMDWSSLLFFMRVYAVLAFVSPLAILIAIWAACRSLAKIESVEKISRWRSVAGRMVLAAGAFHFLLAAIVGFSNYFTSVNRDLIVIEPIMIHWIVTNISRWLFITLPLSLIAATIFWKVTKFPDDVGVF